MRYAIIILAFLFCAIKTDAQVYQAMPQAGYGPVKRMLIDSVLTIPIGISALRNITGGRDTAQIRYQKSDSSVYVYTGSTWVKLGTGGGGGGGSADSTVFFTVYRADTMRANIYGSIPQPDTIYARYPVRISNDTIYLQQTFVDSVYNASSGDATRLVTTVYNNTGSTITKGSVVYISGRHSSNLPTIALAEANNEANSYKTFALVETDITTSNSGRIIQAGKIENLNLPTSTYTDGDILYLSPTVPGGYTTTKPLAPNHIVKLGSVTRAHPTLGSIEIKIENGWELAELSDVQIASVPADSALLQFSRVDSLWKDRTITQAIGPYLNAKANTAGPTFTDSLVLTSTVGGISLPNMTQTQMNAIVPRLGTQVYNTTYDAICTYTKDFGWWSSDPAWLTYNGFDILQDNIYGVQNISSGNFLTNGSQNGLAQNTTSLTNRPSVALLSTFVNAASTSTFINDASMTAFLPGGAILLFETDVQIPTLSNSTETFRFISGLTGNLNSVNTRAVAFLYDSSGASTGSAASGRWQVVCSNASNRSYTTTSVQVTAGQWYRLKAIINAAGTRVDFYIDGNLVKSETNNIPTTGIGINIGIIKSNGTTARTALIDYVRMRQKFTTPR